MTKRIGKTSGLKTRGSISPHNDFSLTTKNRTILISGSTSDIKTSFDVNYISPSESTSDMVADAVVSASNFCADIENIIFWTDNPLVASVDQYGRMTKISDGYTRIYGRNSNGRTVATPLVYVHQETNNSARIFISWLDASLSKHINTNVDTKLQRSIDTKIYTTSDHNNKQYIRNTNCWLNNIDTTCISPWNSYRGQRNTLTPISPLHAITVRHWPGYAGYTYRYITNDNQVVDRIVSNRYDLPYGDISVSIFSQELPNTIKFAKVLPPNINDYLPTIYQPDISVEGAVIPGIWANQFEEIVTGDTIFMNNNYISWAVSADPLRQQAYRMVQMYDSGHPAFFVINNEIVLSAPIASLSLIGSGGGIQSGPCISNYYNEINEAMSRLGGGYQLTTVDLSDFANYGV